MLIFQNKILKNLVCCIFFFLQRKLQEVRERLNQLRDLVQYYQKIKTEPMQESTEQDDFQALTTQRPQ